MHPFPQFYISILTLAILKKMNFWRQVFFGNLLRGTIGQKYQAGAEGRKSVLGRLKAVADGRFLKKNPLKARLRFSMLNIF